jgi:hypothetical protein
MVLFDASVFLGQSLNHPASPHAAASQLLFSDTFYSALKRFIYQGLAYRQTLG